MEGLRTLRAERLKEMAEAKAIRANLEAEARLAEAKAYGEKRAEMDAKAEADRQAKILEAKLKKEETERMLKEKRELAKLEFEQKEALASVALKESLAKQVKLNKSKINPLNVKEKLLKLKALA